MGNTAPGLRTTSQRELLDKVPYGEVSPRGVLIENGTNFIHPEKHLNLFRQ